MAIVTKSDFPGYVDLPASIMDNDIDPFIRLATDFELAPKIGFELTRDLTRAAEGVIQEADRPELFKMLNEWVKTFLIFASYKRFLRKHGRDVSPSGLVSIKGGNVESVSDHGRADLVSQVNHDLSICETNLLRELHAANWRFDDTQYTNPGAKPTNTASFSFSSIN